MLTHLPLRATFTPRRLKRSGRELIPVGFRAEAQKRGEKHPSREPQISQLARLRSSCASASHAKRARDQFTESGAWRHPVSPRQRAVIVTKKTFPLDYLGNGHELST